MTTSSKEHQFDTEYINPMVDSCLPQQENPLVLMAQACNNIGKDLSIPIKQISPPLKYSSSKQRKSHLTPDRKKSVKRTASPSPSSPPTKKSSTIFDSLVLHHLNQMYSSSFQSSYLIDSILSSPFVCNSTIPNGFQEQCLINPNHLFSYSSLPLYNSALQKL
ncbi:unnamed protein product [Adineta ricciae]|uniref:Uncharacterized protein n=1 Tax=Adineta ricciae TaxID=249248 RepID=A0A814R8Y7_ADIRI|nr:unnamed protein product [Adineta ricciae]CAF1676072.1 unnamed protein product [Adineta ricciae]